MSVQDLTEEQAGRVAAFGLDRPVGADDGVLYRAGDVDPTPRPGLVSGYCEALRGSRARCTWPAGHEHPQHVAGGTSGLVVAAWPIPEEQSWRDRAVALLRLQEQAARDEARRIRAQYDEGGAMAPAISEVLKQEARAGAFASAVEIVEGVPL